MRASYRTGLNYTANYHTYYIHPSFLGMNEVTDRQTDGQPDRQTNRQTDRQAGRQTDRQTDRQNE